MARAGGRPMTRRKQSIVILYDNTYLDTTYSTYYSSGIRGQTVPFFMY